MFSEAIERLGACHFMNKVAVNVKERTSARKLCNDVGIPDFVEKRLWHRELVYFYEVSELADLQRTELPAVYLGS